MKKIKLAALCIIGLLVNITATAQVQKIAGVKKVPDKAKFMIVEPRYRSLIMTLDYTYDRQGRVTQIKSANNRYTFAYSYNAKGQVSRVHIVYDDNKYVQADFTYGASGMIIAVARSGSQKGTFKPYYYGKEKLYKWKDPYGRENSIKMSYVDNTVTEHTIGKDVFSFTYDNSIRNGIANLASPISLQTYLAMDYSVTTLFEEGFLSAVMGRVLKSYKDSRGQGRLYLFTNKTGEFNYLSSSTVPAAGNTSYSVELSYRTPPQPLEVKSNSNFDKVKSTDKIKAKN